MSEFKQRAMVDPTGKLIPESPGSWKAQILGLAGKRVVVQVEAEQDFQTNSQRSYWHGVVVPFFIEQWSRERRYPGNLPPYTHDDIHDLLVKHIAGVEEEEGPLGYKILERKRSRRFNKKQYSHLIDGANRLSLELWKVPLPEPGGDYEAVGV
jgi:hypothetical protein